ncbi:MAG: hypothetical protein IPJ11_12530 [Gemmatimonadetes bacterium]|nr:hypothetical protein [Gemmatimonadota bacterium]
MPRFAARRRPSRPDGLAAAGLVTAGLALGAALGFLVGELVGPRAARSAAAKAPPPRPAIAQ